MRSFFDRALIAISHNCVRMHDLIQELGWDIVCQQSSENPENRSHLWDSNDIRDVLGNNKGTDSIESIILGVGCLPFAISPLNFCPEKLVTLRIWNSKLKRLWDVVQNLVNLEKVDLTDSQKLVELPDFSKADNLKS
ncbi:hypothetical protein HN51_028062, partial [Arachis hypogaea]